jgi:hypothetical protein
MQEKVANRQSSRVWAILAILGGILAIVGWYRWAT